MEPWPGLRTFTAPSSSRSRDSVAWVTATPSIASRRPSSVWERTGPAVISSAMRASRPVLVSAGRTVAVTDGRRALVTRPPPHPRPPPTGGAGFAGSRRLHEEGEESLLGVQTVLRLVEDDAVRAVDDGGGDLLAPVGRQAVQDDAVVRGDGDGALVEHVRL